MQMQRKPMRMGLPLRHITCFAQHFAEVYLELLSNIEIGDFCEN